MATRSWIKTHLSKFDGFDGANVRDSKLRLPLLVSESWQSRQWFSRKTNIDGGPDALRARLIKKTRPNSCVKNWMILLFVWSEIGWLKSPEVNMKTPWITTPVWGGVKQVALVGGNYSAIA